VRGEVIKTAAARVFLVLTSMLAVQLPALAAPTTAAPPYKLAFFNNPITGQNIDADPDGRGNSVPVPGVPSAITTAIVGLFESAAAGSTIDVAMFQAGPGRISTGTTDTQLIKRAIKDAAQRVHAINFLADGSLEEDQTFWDDIDRVNHVNVKRCNHACFRNGHALMHNKFMLVDNTTWTRGTERAVLQMTSNWRNSQLSSRLWNSALQLWGDRQLYNGYRSYFDQMWACAPWCAGEPRPQGFDGEPGSGVHVTLFPQKGVADPVLTELANVDSCAGSEVDIAMNGWEADTRGMAILKQLEDLVTAGCVVRLVVQKSADELSIGSMLPATVLGPTAHCTDSREERTDTTKLTPAVHSKYILIRGSFKGVKGSTVVSTGSERFVNASLSRADETWLKVVSTPSRNQDNAAVYAAYLANFDAMWASTPPC